MTKIMPVIFMGHGSPMNAIEDNDYTQMLASLGARLPRPKAIVCISAHWMTRETSVTHMAQPKTIHDFGGFPQELFNVQYPAPGSPKVAVQIAQLLSAKLDEQSWGLDHGTWSVLVHMYPKADIPVVQLSMNAELPREDHFVIGQKLSVLREQGILILGSGNIVHNLRQIKWQADAAPHAWAEQFDQWVKGKLEARDFRALIHEATTTEAGRLSIPTLEHYLPLLYILGAARADDLLQFEFEGMHNASLSMRSLSFTVAPASPT